MPEEKEEKIWQEIKRRAKEIVRHGSMNVEYKIIDGKIVMGEVLKESIKISY